MRSQSLPDPVSPSRFLLRKSLLVPGMILAIVLSSLAANADEPVDPQQAQVERAHQFVKSLREREFDDAAQLCSKPLQLSAGAAGLRSFLEQAKMTCGPFKDCQGFDWETVADQSLLCGSARWTKGPRLSLRLAFDESGGIAGVWLDGDGRRAPLGLPESGLALGSLKELAAAARHSITVHVQLPDGTNAPKSSVGIWRAVEAGSHPAKERGRLWKDAQNHCDWQGVNGAATGSTMTFSRLIPGRYRVTVREGHDQAGRIGISEPIEVLATMETTEVTIRLQPGTTLTVNPLDVSTQSAMKRPRLSLIPLGTSSPYDQYLPTGREGGPVHFVGLPPGEYRLEASLHANDPGGLEFEMVNPDQTVTIGPTATEVDLPMKARPLTESEINDRWGWTAFGVVEDEHGNSMADVEVRVATGMGTLLGGGRTKTNRDGHYRLRFGEGILIFDPTGVCSQSALFLINHPGYDVKRSTRPLSTTMVRKLPDEDQRGGLRPDEIPQRGQPYRLDFVLSQSEIAESK